MEETAMPINYPKIIDNLMHIGFRSIFFGNDKKKVIRYNRKRKP